MASIEEILDFFDVRVIKYSPKSKKIKNIILSSGGAISFDALFSSRLNLKKAGKLDEYISKGLNFSILSDSREFKKGFEAYCEDRGLLEKIEEIEISEETKKLVATYEKLTLNMDASRNTSDIEYFLTDNKDVEYDLNPNVWATLLDIDLKTMPKLARSVYRRYLPRHPRGVFEETGKYGNVKYVLNSYIPPRWMELEKEERSGVPDKLPILFEKLVNHLIPLTIEREYFYSWLYYSLFERAPVFLILCGAGGIGKNKLNLVMKALHGEMNTADGKRSMLTEKFNSQVENTTLVWFDELKYTMDMENSLKELPNAYAAIEKKGVDATRGTRLYASYVISNNKPRDNYLAFDARKFCPLTLNGKRLEISMSPKEIDELSKKVEDSEAGTFDPVFLYQIAKWVKKHGKSGKWPTLEYKGPMFYKLCHTSMTRAEKRAAFWVLSGRDLPALRNKYNEKNGFLWSEVEEAALKKTGDRSLQFPGYSSMKHFFDVFVDSEGKKGFTTKMFEGNNPLDDFYVKPVKGARVISETELVREINGREEENEPNKKVSTPNKK